MQATNTKQGVTTEVQIVDLATVGRHDPGIGIVASAPSCTPPAADVAGTLEIVARATGTRQGGKTELIRAIAIVIPAAFGF